MYERQFSDAMALSGGVGACIRSRQRSALESKVDPLASHPLIMANAYLVDGDLLGESVGKFEIR